VTILAPQTQDSVTWDLLQFKIPSGKGFTLWINRKTGLLERVEGSVTKQLSDYRSVNGVLLPFMEKKPADSGELTLAYSTRTLRDHLNSAAFAVPFRKDYEMPSSGEVTIPADGGLTFQTTLPITDVALVDLRPKRTWSASTPFASAMFPLQVSSRTSR